MRHTTHRPSSDRSHPEDDLSTPDGVGRRRGLWTRRRVIGVVGGAGAVAGGLAVVGGIRAAEASTAAHSETLLFTGGHAESYGGVSYHSFRIPSIVRTNSDSLLAFAEGRVSSNRDWGNINQLYKRYDHQTRTWSELRQVAGVGQGTWGNATPVVDRDTGTIWLFMSWTPEGYSQSGGDGYTKITEWGQRRVYLTSSVDDGLTWAEPQDLTEDLKPRTCNGKVWAWDAMGPGVGIQTSTGRLVIPAIHRNIYSDDHGATWKVAVITEPGSDTVQDLTSESTIVELLDGRLMRNDRPNKTTWTNDRKRRYVTRGTIEDGFDSYEPDDTLLDPMCEASILRYNSTDPARIVFLNPASTETRRKLRVRISYDEGETWAVSRALSDAGNAAVEALGDSASEGGYTSMVKTAGYRVGALVEVNHDASNSDTSYRSIAYRTFNLAWILNGASE